MVLQRPLQEKGRNCAWAESGPWDNLEYNGNGSILGEGVVSQVESPLLDNHISPTLLFMGGAERERVTLRQLKREDSFIILH